MGWGKRQIPLISPWLASVILQNFEFPHPFPSNSKQCREFSPAQGQRSQFIPLYSPTYSPCWPGVLPQGQADDMCITKQNNRRKPSHPECQPPLERFEMSSVARKCVIIVAMARDQLAFQETNFFQTHEKVMK